MYLLGYLQPASNATHADTKGNRPQNAALKTHSYMTGLHPLPFSLVLYTLAAVFA